MTDPTEVLAAEPVPRELSDAEVDAGIKAALNTRYPDVRGWRIDDEDRLLYRAGRRAAEGVIAAADAVRERIGSEHTLWKAYDIARVNYRAADLTTSELLASPNLGVAATPADDLVRRLLDDAATGRDAQRCRLLREAAAAIAELRAKIA